MRQGLTTAAHCAVANQRGARSVRGRKWLRRCQSRGNRRNVKSQVKRFTRIYFRVCVWLPRDDGVRAQCAASRAAVRMRGHARVPVPVPAGRAAVHVFELAAAGVARGAGAAVGGVEGVVGVVGAGCWRACHVPSVVWLRLAGSDRSLRGASCGRAHAGMRGRCLSCLSCPVFLLCRRWVFREHGCCLRLAASASLGMKSEMAVKSLGRGREL